jgi:predicted NBD/HSP70 family sugar kinase
MQHYVGLDVSVKGTSVCIVDKGGKAIREVKVATEPASVLAVLTEETLAIERIGLEAGPLIAVAVQRVGRSRFAGDLC